MAYSDKVMTTTTIPGMLDRWIKASTEVGTGLVGAPECGDVMRLQIRVNPETKRDRKTPSQNLRLRFGDCFVLARDRVG